MKRRFAVILLFAIACAKQHASPQQQSPMIAEPVSDKDERQSLCDIAHGGTVVSRTGEAMLETSALQAIDGHPGSFWMTPLREVPQSMTIALAAKSRIDKVGIRTVKTAFTANHVAFEASSNGGDFSPMITVKSASTDDAQWFDVAPTEAAFIRVTIVDNLLPDHDVRLYSVLARGKEIEEPHGGDIDGCWTINGQLARFERSGAHVFGALENGYRFDGGFDNRVYRFNWIRGNDYGMALITVSPDGQHLSGLNWHEEAIPMFFDISWFGERRKCRKQEISAGVATTDALLQRVGRVSLFGLRFKPDGSLDIEQSRAQIAAALPFVARFGDRARFVAHEFRQGTPEQNRRFAEKELRALSDGLQAAGITAERWRSPDALVPLGSEKPRQDPVTEAMRALYSTIDLEIRR